MNSAIFACMLLMTISIYIWKSYVWNTSSFYRQCFEWIHKPLVIMQHSHQSSVAKGWKLGKQFLELIFKILLAARPDSLPYTWAQTLFSSPGTVLLEHQLASAVWIARSGPMWCLSSTLVFHALGTFQGGSRGGWLLAKVPWWQGTDWQT